MNSKLGLTGVSLLFLATLAACGGGGGSGDGSAAAPTGGGTTPKGWGTATLIETDNAGNAGEAQIAIDASGNAIAVWDQYDGTRTNIWSNRHTAGTGWGTATLIETDNAGNAGTVQIAIDASGNALAVWHEYDGTRFNIWANRYIAGPGWGTAVLIETDTGSASGAQIAVEANGNAVAVWHQSDGTRNNIWSNRYTVGTGWGAAALIETDNNAHAGYPQIAIDASGNALAVWEQSDGTRNNIWSNRYAVGTGWGTAALIETEDAGHASNPQIAINANGNAVAVWTQFDGTRFNIWANPYTASTGWGTAVLMESDNANDAFEPDITVDANGNALAVWDQSDGTRSNIWSKRYTAGTGWGTAVLVETDNSGDALNPTIALGPNGIVMVVWTQRVATSTRDIWSNRYTADTGWGTAVLIENDAGNAAAPQIAIDGSGNALAVWSQSDGMRTNIWANRFQ